MSYTKISLSHFLFVLIFGAKIPTKLSCNLQTFLKYMCETHLEVESIFKDETTLSEKQILISQDFADDRIHPCLCFGERLT